MNPNYGHNYHDEIENNQSTMSHGTYIHDIEDPELYNWNIHLEPGGKE